MKRKTTVLLIDILGFTCIIAAPFLGWLPGPGGLPLLIIGLSLLAKNHEWAERLLQRVKDHAGQAAKKVSDADPATKIAIDIASVLFIAGAVVLISNTTRSLLTTAAISLIIVGTTMFVTNRDRYQKLWKRLRRRHKRSTTND